MTAAGTAHTHGDLLDGFAAAHDDGVRLLVPAGDGLEPALAQCLGAWKTATVRWCWCTPTSR